MCAVSRFYIFERKQPRKKNPVRRINYDNRSFCCVLVYNFKTLIFILLLSFGNVKLFM